MEGEFITIDMRDTYDEGVFDFIDRVVNYANMRVAIYHPLKSAHKEFEEQLINRHKPMLMHLTAESVIVTEAPPASQAIISSRAIRFQSWKDAENYFL